MFVDEVVLKVIAGSGGDGCTAFRREKYIAYGGPYGGNGGHGADIIFKVDEGLHTLLDLRYQKLIKGEKGENAKEEKNFEDILDFHVKFERIHPFQDGNVPLRYQQQIAA